MKDTINFKFDENYIRTVPHGVEAIPCTDKLIFGYPVSAIVGRLPDRETPPSGRASEHSRIKIGVRNLNEIKSVLLPEPSHRVVCAVVEDALSQGTDAAPFLRLAHQHLSNATTARMDVEDANQQMSEVLRQTAEVLRSLVMPKTAKMEEATGEKPVVSEAVKDLLAEIDAVTAAWSEESISAPTPSPELPHSPGRPQRRRPF